MAFTAEQRQNAATIAQVGQQMGMSQRDILIGLMTAMQESGLRNLKYGDRDSQGLFQQRPSMGWGTVQQVTTPTYAARKFFEGLKGVRGRDGMSLTRAAQAVQRSAFPDAYAKHESSMRALMGEIGAGGAGGASGGFRYQELDVPQGESYQAGRAALNALALGQAGQAASSSDPNLNLVESNEVDLSKTIPIEDENPEGEESGDRIESLAIADVGEGAQEVSNPITSQQAPGGLGSEGPGDLSTGKPDTEVDTKKGYVPLGGDYTSMAAPGTASSLVEKALSFKGTPYKWGGTSPLGFDCVAAGVLVATERGEVPIEDVRAGDMVATPAGPRRVTAQWLVGYRRTILIRSGVGVLECTPDHRVHTQRGWVAAGELVDGDEVTTCRDQSGLFSRGMRTTGTRIRSGRPTGTISRALPVNSTARSGQASTAPSQTATRFTTLTTTPSTTTFEISRRSLSLSTGENRRRTESVSDSSASTAGASSRRTGTLARSGASARNDARRLSATVSTGSVRPVYDLEVEGEHSFFAGGILVHNCSGFTQYVFKQFGINLPRVSYQQGQGGESVTMAELMPGDLIFYDTSSRNNGADHVAIYAGKGMQVEANNPAGRVTFGKVRTKGAWARRYL